MKPSAMFLFAMTSAVASQEVVSASERRSSKLDLPVPFRSQVWMRDLLDGPASGKERVRSLGRNEHGSLVVESSHFRVVYDKEPALMEKVARVAEAVRRELHRKWFGDLPLEFDGKCAVYLYPDRDTYLKRTKSGALAHFRSSHYGGVLHSRAIHLPCDAGSLFEDVLPHEVAHSVMATRFHGQMPRWANEGIATLAESPPSVESHRRLLRSTWRKDELFGFDVLLHTEEKDHLNCVEYYAQSMSLIEFLVAQKGWRTFFAFLRDGDKAGYAAGLSNRYGIGDYAELRRRWLAFFLETDRERSAEHAWLPASAGR